MNHQITIRAFALAAMLGLSACETDRPVTTSTTTTEETTRVQPAVQGSGGVQTTTTYSR